MRVQFIHGFKDIEEVDRRVEGVRKKYLEKFSVFNGENKS